jgi:DUF1365 family protein
VSASCLYTGAVRHRRFAERPTEFRHELALLHLDLDELPGLLDGLLVRRAPGIVRVRRRDYLRPLELPLADAVRAAVAARTGTAPDGPVTMLTHPRTIGHCFNPVSFYYCWTPDRERLQAVLVEVTNTPWGERHAYVLPAPLAGGSVLSDHFDKALHVSPFMGMDQRYAVRLTPPGPTASVHIESRDGGGALRFDATLALTRRELSRASLAASVARYPLATVRVLALIYAHAVRLWLGGVSVHPHPARTRA